MLCLRSSELETMSKKPQTRKITTKCQKNQEADSIINEGKRHSKVKGRRQNQTPVLWDLPVLKFLVSFSSSFSVSLLGLLLAYSLTLKTPFSWLPVWIMALTSSVTTDGEEMSDLLQFQPWKDFQFNTNKPKHQQKSEAIFQMLLSDVCSSW